MGIVPVIRIQDYIVQNIWSGVDAIFRSARTMEPEKLTWSPLDQGRTVLSMLQECAQAPNWMSSILELRAMSPLSRSEIVEARRMRAEWTTIDECEKVCRFNTEKLCRIIADYPDADFEIVVSLPFGPGGTGIEENLLKVVGRNYANLTYHYGQISYIQLMLGDREMR